MGHSINVSSPYLRGLELPELKEDGTLWFIGMDD